MWLSTDPLQEKYPNISTYAYTFLNPVKYIDPTGMEPIKPLVGTAEDFKNVLDNSPSKVGKYKGLQANFYMWNLSNTEFNWNQMRPDPTQTAYFNNRKGRYIYTTKGGWLDMTHFLFYASKAYGYKNSGNPDPIGETVQDGHYQERTDGWAAEHSAYSYEDIPSDYFGADFAVNHFDSKSDLNFGEQLYNYLVNVLGATYPELAPNYKRLPEEDSRNPPTMTNKTIKPIHTGVREPDKYPGEGLEPK